MVYELKMKKIMLEVLADKISSIAACILALLEEGYIPNKKKAEVINWSMILSNVYNNIEIFDEEEQTKADSLYNKVIRL